MTRSRLLTSSLCALFLVGTGCAVDRATAPQPLPQASGSLLGGLLGTVTGVVTTTVNIVGSLLQVNVLQRDQALSQPITRTVHLYHSSGTIQFPETGLTVYIPAAAIGDTAATISVTAIPGNMVAYDFEPHGAKFAVPLVATQTLSNTSWSGSSVTAGYFADDSQLDPSTGTALLNQLLPTSIGWNRVTFGIPHFSGYLISTGRTGAQ